MYLTNFYISLNNNGIKKVYQDQTSKPNKQAYSWPTPINEISCIDVNFMITNP